MTDSEDTRTSEADLPSRSERKFSVSSNRDKASHKMRYVETGGAVLDTEDCTFCQPVPESADDKAHEEKPASDS